jgi:hypothetical protein
MRIQALALSAVTMLAFTLAVTPPAQAAPVGSCPPGKWMESTFPLDWQPGDPTDPNGENLILQSGVAGLVAVFGSLEAAMAAFGFESFDAFYAEIADPGFNKADHNGDGVLCFELYPATSNNPPYTQNTIDNTAGPKKSRATR